MMKIKRCKLLLLFLMLRVCVMAQTDGYHYRANINPVDSSGFYNIVLTPQINVHLKDDCSDFRIINDSGKWIPHLLRAPNSEFVVESCLMDLKIIKKENSASGTDIIVKGFDTSISNLYLEMKNSLSERYVTS